MADQIPLAMEATPGVDNVSVGGTGGIRLLEQGDLEATVPWDLPAALPALAGDNTEDQALRRPAGATTADPPSQQEWRAGT